MPSYRVATDITADAPAVFALVGDLSRHGDWAADPVQVTAVDDSPVVAGKKYTSSATSKGKTFTADLEVTEYEPSERFAFRATDATGAYEHIFDIRPTVGGSQVERTITGTLSLPQALLFYAVLLPVKKPSARKALANLKQQAELATSP